MTIEKCKDFVKDGYSTWDDTSKPTTFANMYDFMKNQNNIVMNLAQGLWQPSTTYAVGTIIRSPSLPAGCVATCTTAGTTGSTEPTWTAYGTTVTDGSCKWKVNTDSQDTMVSEMNNVITSAINSLHNTIKSEITKTLSDNMHAQYPVGSYIYSDKADNPATYLPYMSDTTWVQTAAGRVLIGAGTADSGTVYNAGDTGGEEKHQLTVEELPNVTGDLQFRLVDGDSNIVNGGNNMGQNGVFTFKKNEGSKWSGSMGDGPNATRNTDIISMNFGNDVPHNNMPPYAVVYIFCRTA